MQQDHEIVITSPNWIDVKCENPTLAADIMWTCMVNKSLEYDEKSGALTHVNKLILTPPSTENKKRKLSDDQQEQSKRQKNGENSSD